MELFQSNQTILLNRMFLKERNNIAMLQGFIFILFIQCCVHAGFIRRDYRQPLTAPMVYGGNVDEVKTILTGRIEAEKLDRSLNIVRKFDRNASRTDNVDALKEMFVIVFASKSNTSESDWLKMMAGDRSVLTQTELQEISIDMPKKSNYDKWWLLEKLTKFRMNAENANRIQNIFNQLNKGSTDYQLNEGMANLLKVTVAALANKPEDEVKQWMCS